MTVWCTPAHSCGLRELHREELECDEDEALEKLGEGERVERACLGGRDVRTRHARREAAAAAAISQAVMSSLGESGATTPATPAPLSPRLDMRDSAAVCAGDGLEAGAAPAHESANRK